MEDKLILVDSFDREIGSMGKQEAHEKAMLHRAFSVFVIYDGKMLIQKRAYGKYHSGGLWANACCSHPRLGENLLQAVYRRMMEELGFYCQVEEIFSFTYFHQYADKMHEYEFDHVFVGEYKGEIRPNPEEIAKLKWIKLDVLEKDMRSNPHKYSVWFHIAAPKVIKYVNDKA